MRTTSRSGFLAFVGTGLLFGGCADQAADPVGIGAEQQALSEVAYQSDAIVNWHAQQAGLGRTGPVAGASASLVRTSSGASFRVNTAELTPGNAYTLWLVVINNPDACASTPCTAADIILNAAADAQVRFAAGHVASGSGRGTFAGAVAEGPLSGWLADRSFHDSMAAEIHLVINDHGQMLPDYMPGMIQTYRGGCANTSPFPGVFPASALADGEPGPNTCRLYQAAVFLAP